ncbi:MAG: hypothetical protein H8E98_01330 [Bacteroidetes bacterium]|nr:hypothetical protein [Bacteroidota bacterium]
MELIKEQQAIVIIGGWNPSIFSPEWVSKYLFDGEKLKVEFPLNTSLPPRISNEKMRLTVEANKFNIIPIEISDENYQNMEDVIVKVIDYLPHTPVTALGVNFHFVDIENKVNTEILEILNSDVSDKVTGVLDQTTIKRAIREDDYILNMETIYHDSKTIINFNYHFNLNKISGIKEKIDNNSIVSLKNKSMDILKKLHQTG